MSERKRVLILILIMAISSMILAGVTISVLYHTSFKEQQARLVETAQSQARLIEAIARFDKKYSKDYPAGPEKATLSQIIDAHEHYRGFGKTGEFTLSKKKEDNIVFLLSHRHFDLDQPRPVPFQSELAEPMRRALLGHSGTVVGLDYRGEIVMAAHEPVAELDLGIVAKIDLSEIRAPFLKTSALAGLFTVIVVLAGVGLFIKITNPMIRQLENRAAELETMTDEMGREIEERKRVEEALQESELKYRQLVEQLQEGIWAIDKDANTTFVNPRMAEMIGYTVDEMQGKHLFSFMDKRGIDISKRNLERRKQGIIEQHDFELLHKNGERVYTSMETSPVTDEDGNYVGALACVADITQRKRIEDALQNAHDNLDMLVKERTAELTRSNVFLKQEIADRKRVEKALEAERQRLFSVLNELPAFIYLQAPDHSIRFANRWFQDHFGHYEKKKCYEALRARNEPCEDCPPVKVFETGKYQEWESTRLNDGRIYQVYAYPFTDIDGSQLVLELGIDITKRKQAESEIRRLSSRLLNAQEDERRRVAFELHDELGQNLSVLKLQVGSIKRKLRKDQSALQKICETVLLEFNNTIEEVRRISAALSPSILVDLGLSPALRWLVKNFANNSKVRISIDIPDTLNVFSQEQQIAIYRIFQEILTNIGKHARATHASVDSKMKTDTAVFRVEDNGIGFDAEQIQARPGSEKGLGLTAMEERIKMLDGQFQILSREGKGTKIAFEIPVDIPA